MFLTALVLLNFPLVHGETAALLIFQPTRPGEWWRLLAHPFVHVSWYHLLLDGPAFLMLYHGLSEPRLLRRLSFVIGLAAGSLLVALWASPLINTSGLCGLSGVAHGLMAISGLEMMFCNSPKDDVKWIGVFCFWMAVIKAGLEAATGQVFFTFLHFGWLGSPVAVCQAGGVLGGIAAFVLRRRRID